MVEEKLHRLQDLAKDQQGEESFDSAGGRICGTRAALQVAALSVKTATFVAEQLHDIIQGFASGMMTQQQAARNVPSLLGKRNITEAMNMNFRYVPQRVSITETAIQRFGPTPGCTKCQAARSTIRRYFTHTPGCRERLTNLMCQDERFRRLVEAIDERQVEFLDMQDIAARKQRKQQREEQHRSADAGARGTGEAFGSQREEPCGPAHAGTRGTGGAKKDGMVDIRHKRRCACGKHPCLGFPGDRTPTCCSSCK